MFRAKCLVWLLLGVVVVLSFGYYVECCVEEERLALLRIKAYMLSYAGKPYDPTNFNPWYNNSQTNDCCKWYGVHCNVFSGHVTHLNLSFKVSRAETNNTKKPWRFNVTLFRPFTQLISLDLGTNDIKGLVEQDGSTKILTLKKLQYLNLEYNLLEKSHISVRVLTSLRTLILSGNFFNASSFLLVSQGICKTKNLVELRLDYNLLHGVLPSCFKDLISLKTLDLSHNKLSGNFPKVLLSFKSLKFLDLTENNFEGRLSMDSLSSLPNLQVLRLSTNMLEVQLTDSSCRPKFQLQTLGLGGCKLNKTFEAFPAFFSYQTNLSKLDLSSNNLLQPFPIWLFNDSSKLQVLILANNSLTGKLQLPHVATNTTSLQKLDISNNNFNDQLPQNFGLLFPHLKHLNISGNHFEGLISTSITQMRGLEYLDLSNNNFSGKLPKTMLCNFAYLDILKLSSNNLEGDIIPEDMNLPSLSWLSLSKNRFSGTLKDSLSKSSGLIHLDLSNNNITGQLPSWIGNFSILSSLSMSQNNLQGHIPKEICSLERLDYLDLSLNNFSGYIPSCTKSCSYSYMDFRINSLSGVIPDTLSNCTQLQSLDLTGNQLSGGIPSWINKLSKLTILMLARNHLYGPIPQQLCELGDINILDLSHNDLFGGIPICIGNLSFGMTISFDPNYFELGVSMGTDEDFDVYGQPEEAELLNKNQFLSYEGKNLAMMSMLDLSTNKLTGDIPPQLGKLEYIHTLNLSHNLLSGSIPSQFSNLKLVESLDLSYNRLNGRVPSELVKLNFLEIFNVSYNNLSGRVPETGQFANFDERNYCGNPGLYGYHKVNDLRNPNKALPLAIGTQRDEDHSGFEMVDFLWSFTMSCVTMFLATIIILYINPQWRIGVEQGILGVLTDRPFRNKLANYHCNIMFGN